MAYSPPRDDLPPATYPAALGDIARQRKQWMQRWWDYQRSLPEGYDPADQLDRPPVGDPVEPGTLNYERGWGNPTTISRARLRIGNKTYG